MDSDSKQRRVFWRNAIVCFGCTAVCLGIDIKNFILAGGFFFTWNIGLSFVLYIVLIWMGIRAVKKARELK